MIANKKIFFLYGFIIWNYVFISECSLVLPPKADRYYFPEYYRGWICVQYNIENAPPLPIENGFLVHKIPENGLLVTSSMPRMIAPSDNEYYYYTNTGVRAAKELQHGGGFTEKREKENKITYYFWISCCGYLDSDYENYVKNYVDIDKNPKYG